MFGFARKFKVDLSALPTHDEMAEHLKVLKYSPDAALLSQYKGWHLFCYSREQIGHPDYQLISDATHIGTAYSLREFSGWRKIVGHGSYAIALDNNAPIFDDTQEEYVRLGWEPMMRAYKNKIKGEIHFVTPDTITALDSLLENGVAFERRRVTLQLPYRFLYEAADGSRHVSFRRTEIIVAWMYIGKNDYWNPLLDNGFLFKPMKLFQPNDPDMSRFYSFDKLSYER